MCNGGYLWIFLTQFKTSIFIYSARIFNKNCLTLLCWLFISCFFAKVRLIWLWSNKNKITFSCLLFSHVTLSAFMLPLLAFTSFKFQLLFSLLRVSKTLPCQKNVASLFIITLCKYHIPPEILAVSYSVGALGWNWTHIHVQTLEWHDLSVSLVRIHETEIMGTLGSTNNARVHPTLLTHW